MDKEIKVAMIGLDTSHTIEFSRRMNAPDCREDLKVKGLRAVSGLRFDSIFQNKEGLDKRQQQLEAWGIPVTTSFGAAVRDCDALMLTINDPALHKEYFQRCAGLGKPVFLDKPMAGTMADGLAIAKLAQEKKTRVFSASAMRFVPMVLNACKAMPNPRYTHVYGAVGGGPAGYTMGGLIVWYGIHTFEILERTMGRGAVSVFTKKDHIGAILTVEYPERRRGVVELTNQVWLYGGTLRDGEKAASFVMEVPYMVHNSYTDGLTEILKFFRGGPAPVAMEDTLEVMNMLDAAARSAESGKEEKLTKI